MTDNKMPTIVMMPEAQAQIDADPVLAQAMKGFKEAMLNAVQGFEDGRYKSIDDAMEAMTGSRPQRIEPPHPPKYGYCLGYGVTPKGKKMAIITDGRPDMGHKDFEIMATKEVGSCEEARAWYDEIAPTLPWREE